MSVSPDHTGEVIRVFIAVNVGNDIREFLVRRQQRLMNLSARVSWTRPESMHLTLAFLGEIDDIRCAGLAGSLDDVAADVRPFRFEVRGEGLFGPEKAPRVVWAGVADEEGGLATLHRGVNGALDSLGFPTEDRPFRPHLTLGRVRSRRGVAELTSTVASDNNSPLGWVQVEHLLLMRSQLHPQGAQYSVIHKSPLKGVEIDGHESI